jgi:hypothetical protein
MLRGIIGAALGASTAAVAIRVRGLWREREQPLQEVLADLPAILAQDASRIGDAARGALADGRDAAYRARIEFDEQVDRHARRTRGEDV